MSHNTGPIFKVVYDCKPCSSIASEMLPDADIEDSKTSAGE
jgi:hypothetical protein